MDTPSPTLIIATDTQTFNITPWQREGYNALHVPCASARAIENATDDIEPNTKCALLAFGKSAMYALALATSSLPSLCAVVAYYPPRMPPAPGGFHPGVRVLLHLPADAPFSPATNPPHVTVRVYDSVGSGFAEEGAAGYDGIAAGLAYSRSLGILRSAIGPEVDLEGIWDEHVRCKFVEMDADKAMDTMVPEPRVNHVPTC
jgi:hypothetical protein